MWKWELTEVGSRNAEVGNDMHRAESIAQGVNEDPKVQLYQLGQKIDSRL
jgi:hypothetical protein